MASYREKLNQKQMETELGKIAWCIVWIEGHWNWKKDLIFNGSIDLFDGKYARIYKLYDENNPTLTEEIECNYTYTLYKSGEAPRPRGEIKLPVQLFSFPLTKNKAYEKDIGHYLPGAPVGAGSGLQPSG